jgi:hypothetical protein
MGGRGGWDRARLFGALWAEEGGDRKEEGRDRKRGRGTEREVSGQGGGIRVRKETEAGMPEIGFHGRETGKGNGRRRAWKQACGQFEIA